MAQADPYYWTRDLFKTEAQRKALGQTKGFSPEELSSVISANFAAQQEHEITEKNIQLSEKSLALSEQKLRDQEKAQRQQAITSGVSGLVQTGLILPQAIKGYQDIGWLGKPAVTGAGSTTGATAATTVDTGAAVVNTPGVTGQAALTTGTEATGMGTGAALGYGAIAGEAGYLAGSNIVKGKYSETAGIAASTAAGFAVGGPYGAAAGFAVGVLNSMSIICTELNNQGYISDSQLRVSTIYVNKHVPRQTYIGYLIFADPIVKAMKKSKLFTLLIKPYGLLLCRECSSRIQPEKYKSTWLSRLTYTVSTKYFDRLYRKSHFNRGGAECLTS